ncbi:hypothetical protein CsSME_00024577 [Camellia sinensis var. sinensis]
MQQHVMELACENMQRWSKHTTICKTSMQQHARDGLKPKWANLSYAQISGHSKANMHANWLKD